MGLSAADHLAIFEVGVYVLLINPITYCLFKHGRKGLIGWLSLQSFCFVRIIGNILILKDGSRGTASIVVNSIGLSPLLTGTLGLLHEAREARHPKLARRKEWCFVINYHALLAVGMVMVVMGIVALISHQGVLTNTQKLLLRIGITLIVASYFILFGWTVFSLMGSQIEPGSPAYKEGTTLIYGIIAALPFAGIRLTYGVIGFADDINGKTSTTFQTSDALKVAMSAIPELIMILVYSWVGIKTRHIKQAFDATNYTKVYVGPGGQQNGNPHDDRVPLTYIPPQQERIYEPYKSPPYVTQTAL